MHPNPYRMMKGATIGGTSANHYSVSLYNDSSGPELLIVWDATEGITVTDILYCRTVQGIQGTLVTAATTPSGVVTRVVAGEAPLSGLFYYADLAAFISPDVYLSVAVNSKTNTGRWPLAVLQPGWSFQAQGVQSAGQQFAFSFTWESVHIEDLRGIHCPICDVLVLP